jgi:hypothetical protein
MRRIALLCASLLGFALTFGCGGGNDKLYPVSGQVTVGDQPAVGAVVTFIPNNASQDGSVSFGVGTCDEQGNFTAMTSGQPGMCVGSYTVTVVWPDPKKPLTDAQKMMGMQPNDLPDLLNGKYANKEKSNLSATIQAGDNTLPKFELKGGKSPVN